MRRRDYFWSLFHVPRKKQIDDLRTDQVEAIFEALPEDDRKQWRVWREGFQAWKEFDEFPLFLEQLRRGVPKAIETPPVPHGQVAQFDRAMEKTIALELEQTRVQAEKNRGGVRYVNKLSVKIILENQVVQTTTTNISMQGMQLATPLPKKLPRYFQVDLSLQKKTIPLLCSALSEEGDEPIRRLRIEANEYEDLLKTWLISMGEAE